MFAFGGPPRGTLISLDPGSHTLAGMRGRFS